MARSRNLKPSFFLNEALAEVAPLGRLLFQGLWCQADRCGRLEDRPLRIKASILPYDNCKIDDLLQSLVNLGFITRYEVNGNRYIHIVNFEKHQNPHVKEPESTIPAPDLHQTSPVLNVPLPSSLNPLPLTLIPSTPAVPAGAFETIWKKYPRKLGKDISRDRFKAQVKTFQDWLDIQNAVDRFNRKLQADKTEEKFIPHGSTWFNRVWHDWVNYTENSHGANGSQGVSEYAAIAEQARAARRAAGIGAPVAAGEILAGLRDMPVVQDIPAIGAGSGHDGDGDALENVSGGGVVEKESDRGREADDKNPDYPGRGSRVGGLRDGKISRTFADFNPARGVK